MYWKRLLYQLYHNCITTVSQLYHNQYHCLTCFYIFKQTLQFFQQMNVKNVHPVYGAVIRTHILWKWVSSHNHLTRALAHCGPCDQAIMTIKLNYNCVLYYLIKLDPTVFDYSHSWFYNTDQYLLKLLQLGRKLKPLIDHVYNQTMFKIMTKQ